MMQKKKATLQIHELRDGDSGPKRVGRLSSRRGRRENENVDRGAN